MITIIISFDDVFTSCQQMSSYEGRRAYDTNGESMYDSVHLVNQDKTLVYNYARTACDAIARQLKYILVGTREDEDSYAFDFVRDKSIVMRENAREDMSNVVSSFVMWQWLLPVLPDRAKAWEDIYTSQYESLQRVWYRLNPTL